MKTKFIRVFKKINNSLNGVTFKMIELKQFGINTGDVIEIEIKKVISKAYKCNNCIQGICRLNIDKDPNPSEDTKMFCDWCRKSQLLKDSIIYVEWKKQIKT